MEQCEPESATSGAASDSSFFVCMLAPVAACASDPLGTLTLTSFHLAAIFETHHLIAPFDQLTQTHPPDSERQIDSTIAFPRPL